MKLENSVLTPYFKVINWKYGHVFSAVSVTQMQAISILREQLVFMMHGREQPLALCTIC